MKPLELWAGPECTVNRVGDEYHDQLRLTGFHDRPDDLDRLASLGIRRLRFPLLWERAAPQGGRAFDWRWSDERLDRLRALGVAPIAGLLHHGSGPPDTHLLDPAFPQRLAEYARAAAERYPWIDAWTPVNEPLTTARFSGLYGLWHPHRRDDRSFVRALLNQLRGSVLAMQAIRAVNPAAQWVQTEDLGWASSTPRLAGQARFENRRRWLGFDLLCGRVRPGHALWHYLRRNGASREELLAFAEAGAPVPDLLGINCYVTSERFLDEDLARYPACLHGGNGRQRYADVETVRVHPALPGGFAVRLRETWARYRRPVAITEVHLGCTREEQMRWLHQAWQAAQAVRAEGADVRAVTAWAAFGTFDWNQLLTRFEGHYEPGLWDVRGGTPRATALATLAAQLARGESADHPVLAGPGWWQRALRLRYPPRGPVQALPEAGRPLLITGARGTLARAFARLCDERGLPCRLLSRGELDIAEPASVDAALERWQPWGVVNAAGFVRVDEAEALPQRQWRENALGPAVLAERCAREQIALLSFSSDLVFDGHKRAPYVESDLPAPLNAYGRGKLEAERRVLARAPRALMVRSSAFFGPWDGYNFVTLALQALARGERWPAAVDQWVSPTYVPDLVRTCLDLLLDGESGVWHLANRGAVTWAELAAMAAEGAGLDRALIDARAGATLGQVAARPRYSALASERCSMMPTLADGLQRYFDEGGGGTSRRPSPPALA